MKQRIAEAVAVELGQRVKRIHVAKIEQPDGPLILEDIARTEVPLHEPGLLASYRRRQDLAKDVRIEAVEWLPRQPGGENDAQPIVGVQGRHYVIEPTRPGRIRLQAGEIGPPLHLVQKRGFTIDVAHQRLGAALFESVVFTIDTQMQHPGRQTTAEVLDHQRRIGCQGRQLSRGQGTGRHIADHQRLIAGRKGELGLLTSMDLCIHRELLMFDANRYVGIWS